MREKPQSNVCKCMYSNTIQPVTMYLKAITLAWVVQVYVIEFLVHVLYVFRRTYEMMIQQS